MLNVCVLRLVLLCRDAQLTMSLNTQLEVWTDAECPQHGITEVCRFALHILNSEMVHCVFLWRQSSYNVLILYIRSSSFCMTAIHARFELEKKPCRYIARWRGGRIRQGIVYRILTMELTKLIGLLPCPKVQWLRWLLAGLSPRRLWFNFSSVHVGFMLDEMALGGGSSGQA